MAQNSVTVHHAWYNIQEPTNQGNKMDLIPRTSYAPEIIKAIKQYYFSRYNCEAMDCADMFRNDEWKVIDDADYGKNTRNDLIKMTSDNLAFKSFVEEVISCMKYNKSMEMD